MALIDRRVWPVIRLALTAGVVWAVFARLDGPLLWRVFETARPEWMAATLACMVLATLFSAQASRETLGGLGIRLSYPAILRTNYESFFYALLGELAGGMRRWHGFGGGADRGREAFTAMLIERLQQVAIYGALCGLTFGFFAVGPFDASEARLIRLAAPALSAAAAAGLWCVCRGSLRGLPWIGRWVVPEETSLAPLGEGGALTRSMFWMGFQSAAGYALYLAVFEAAGIRTGWAQTLWAFCLAGLAQSAPLTICGLGLREGVLLYALSRLGVPAERAVAAGLLIFSAALFLSAVGGALILLGRRQPASEGE